MESPRWSWTYRYGVSLFVASLVSVVAAAAGLLTVVVLGGDGQSPPTDPGPSTYPGPSTDPAPSADPVTDADCVVGRWRVTEQSQAIPVLGFIILDGDGPVVEFRADGTGTTDYGDGVTYQVEDTLFGGLGSHELVVTGTVTYDYTADDATIRYSNYHSNATRTDSLGNESPHQLSDEPHGYHCAADAMTFQLEGVYDAELRRLDEN